MCMYTGMHVHIHVPWVWTFLVIVVQSKPGDWSGFEVSAASPCAVSDRSSLPEYSEDCAVVLSCVSLKAQRKGLRKEEEADPTFWSHCSAWQVWLMGLVSPIAERPFLDLKELSNHVCFLFCCFALCKCSAPVKFCLFDKKLPRELKLALIFNLYRGYYKYISVSIKTNFIAYNIGNQIS